MSLFSLLMFSCTSVPPAEPEVQLWQGWVYEDIPLDGTLGLEDGEIRMTSVDSDTVFEGEQRDETRLGMWTFEVEPDTEVAIRIAGAEHYPTVWMARTPYTEGYWYSGAIFGVRTATFDAFLESLAELTGEEASDHEGAHLYGEPLPLTMNDIEAWTDARITVYDGDGHIHEATTLVLDEETGGLVLPGSEPAPIAAFTASDLAPGAIALVIEASDGRSTVVEYQAEAGDLLSAFAFTLPLENR